jgi:hypothetical protein
MAIIFIFKEGILATYNKISDMCLTAEIGIIEEGGERPTARVAPDE